MKMAQKLVRRILAESCWHFTGPVYVPPRKS